MLEVKKLTVCYNDFLALNEISLKIQEGALNISRKRIMCLLLTFGKSTLKKKEHQIK